MQHEQHVVDWFFAKTTLEHNEWFAGTKCLLWTASAGTKSGRGRFWDGNRRCWVAPQFAYVIEHGELPAGMVVWQNCGNRLCVNHQHLEAVTETESVRRAHQRYVSPPTFRCCGREKTVENTYVNNGVRRCKPCMREAQKRYAGKPGVREREIARHRRRRAKLKAKSETNFQGSAASTHLHPT